MLTKSGNDRQITVHAPFLAFMRNQAATLARPLYDGSTM